MAPWRTPLRLWIYLDLISPIIPTLSLLNFQRRSILPSQLTSSYYVSSECTPSTPNYTLISVFLHHSFPTHLYHFKNNRQTNTFLTHFVQHVSTSEHNCSNVIKVSKMFSFLKCIYFIDDIFGIPPSHISKSMLNERFYQYLGQHCFHLTLLSTHTVLVKVFSVCEVLLNTYMRQ